MTDLHVTDDPAVLHDWRAHTGVPAAPTWLLTDDRAGLCRLPAEDPAPAQPAGANSQDLDPAAGDGQDLDPAVGDAPDPEPAVGDAPDPELAVGDAQDFEPAGATVTVVLATLTRPVVVTLAAAGLRSAARLTVIVCAGLARPLPPDGLVDLLAPDLLPVDAAPVRFGGFRGTQVTLAPPAAEDRLSADALRLAALGVAAVDTAGWGPEEAALGLRVAVHGAAWGWADGLAGCAPVSPAWATDPAALRRASPDVVVLGPGADPAGPHTAAVQAARDAGAALVDVGAPAGWNSDATDGLIDPFDPALLAATAAGAAGGADGAGPVTLRRWQPDVALTAACAAGAAGATGAAGDADGGAAERLVRAAAADLLADCAHGRPVVADRLPAPVAALLGTDLAGLLTDPTAGEPADLSDLTDPTVRDRHGVRLRRAAFALHSVDGRWRHLAGRLGRSPAPLPVSVLTVTDDPALLWPLLADVAAQTHRPLQLSVVTVGVGAPEGWLERATSLLEGHAVHRQVPAATPGSAALTAASAAADGHLLVVLDPAGLHGPAHVTDLLQARRAHTATLVGHAGEFVYVPAVQRTLRLLDGGTAGPASELGAGSVLLAAADLAAVGGWAGSDPLPRLVGAVGRAGGLRVRTHGFGALRTVPGVSGRQAGTVIWEAPGLRRDAADAADATGGDHAAG